MKDLFIRTEMILGHEAMEKLRKSTVAVLGIGGVGGSACETLVRSGVGNVIIVDKDIVSFSNINRQIIATLDTVGRKKTEVMEERIQSINPNCNVKAMDDFILSDNIESIIGESCDYVLDCIDTVTAKINVIEYCKTKGIRIISSMGAGNKVDPSKLEITDLKETKNCPLARVLRHELRKRNIESVEVIYSSEIAIKPLEIEEESNSLIKTKRMTPGSCAFVPPVAGIMMAGHVIRRIIE